MQTTGEEAAVEPQQLVRARERLEQERRLARELVARTGTEVARTAELYQVWCQREAEAWAAYEAADPGCTSVEHPLYVAWGGQADQHADAHRAYEQAFDAHRKAQRKLAVLEAPQHEEELVAHALELARRAEERQQQPEQESARRPPVPSTPEVAELERLLAEHRAGYEAYYRSRDEAARLEKAGQEPERVRELRAVQEQHRPSYTAHKAAYRKLLALRRAAP